MLEVLGRIRAAIEKKQFAADQLKAIIDGANAEIARLEAEIARRDEIYSLWLDQFKSVLADAAS